MKLTNENYFSQEANEKYMSVSQFKKFDNCQAMAMAELNEEYERETTSALLMGSYVDAYFEGSLNEFQSHHPELFKHDGSLKSEYVQAEYIIKRIERDNLFMEYMSGKKQVIMTGEIDCVPVKIKVDSLHPNKIVDLKIMRDFEPIYLPEQGRVSFIEAWKYDLQGAVYQEIVRQNTGELLPFYIAAATKEKEPDISIIHVPQELLDFELKHFKESVSYYQSLKSGAFESERCEKCDYCKRTKKLMDAIELGDLIDE